jgi:hypothetical protein
VECFTTALVNPSLRNQLLVTVWSWLWFDQSCKWAGIIS